jgi:hypothetical protein
MVLVISKRSLAIKPEKKLNPYTKSFGSRSTLRKASKIKTHDKVLSSNKADRN